MILGNIYPKEMSRFKKLIVYQKAFALAMDIFRLTKSFPREEQFALVSQIRRSSRAICGCIGEAYRKRQYSKHFVSKTSDADMENTETQVWLDFALECEYISSEIHQDFTARSQEIGRMLFGMINSPEKFK